MLLTISANAAGQALQIALYGMLGIFGVLTVIMVMVILLNRMTAEKDGDQAPGGE